VLDIGYRIDRGGAQLAHFFGNPPPTSIAPSAMKSLASPQP
jgi:hypothetical protein